MRRPAGIAIAAGVAVLSGLALLLWLRGGSAYRGATGDASLLLITVDGLRADRVGACGGPAGLTPALDALAGRGVIFCRTITASVTSRPSHASLLTGQWPSQHGVRDRDADRLPARLATLAGMLTKHRFQTASIVSSPDLSGLSGLDQGFGIHDDTLPGPWRPARAATADAIERLRHAGEGRGFLWVHYTDPILPLAAPEPFRSTHAGRPYDGIVAHVDAEIGRLLDHLEASGRARRTLVVVAGSHGHSLGAHGEMLSGSTVHDEAARVPLLVSLPPHVPSGVRPSGVVRTVDVVPTVLELLRIPREPSGTVPGVSLWPAMAGHEPGEPPIACVEAMDGPGHGWSAVQAVRDGRFLFAESPRPELYDLVADPGQSTNVASARSDLTGGYRARLAALCGGAGAPPDDGAGPLPDVKEMREALNRAERARMAASAGQHEVARREAREGLAQRPADRRLRLILARSLAAQGLHEEAIPAFREVLAAWPGHRSAMEGLGVSLERAGRIDEARDHYQRAAELDPDDPRWPSGLARAALARRDAAEAARLFTAALRSRPDHLPAIDAMADLLESAGKLEEAAAFHARAVEVQPLRLQGLMGWSWVLFRLQRHDQALEVLRKAQEIAPSAAVDTAMGDVYLASGRNEEAVQAYRRALESDPRAAQALYGLGVLELKGGAPGSVARSVDLLGRALELKPQQATWREDYARALAAAGRFGPAADQMDLFLTSGQAPAARREPLRQEAADWRRRMR